MKLVIRSFTTVSVNELKTKTFNTLNDYSHKIYFFFIVKSLKAMVFSSSQIATKHCPEELSSKGVKNVFIYFKPAYNKLTILKGTTARFEKEINEANSF